MQLAIGRLHDHPHEALATEPSMLLCMKVTLLYSVGLIPRLGAQQDGIYSTSGSWAKIGIRGLLPPLLAQFPGGGGEQSGNSNAAHYW